MARTPDYVVWCPVCYCEPAGPGGRCSVCSPPRFVPAHRCAWCGSPASTEFCGQKCAASAFESRGLWGQFAADAAAGEQVETQQIDAAAIAEALAWKYEVDF